MRLSRRSFLSSTAALSTLAAGLQFSACHERLAPAAGALDRPRGSAVDCRAQALSLARQRRLRTRSDSAALRRRAG